MPARHQLGSRFSMEATHNQSVRRSPWSLASSPQICRVNGVSNFQLPTTDRHTTSPAPLRPILAPILSAICMSRSNRFLGTFSEVYSGQQLVPSLGAEFAFPQTVLAALRQNRSPQNPIPGRIAKPTGPWRALAQLLVQFGAA